MSFDKTPQIYEGQGPTPKPKRARPAGFASDAVRRQAHHLFSQGYGYKYVADKLKLSVHTVRDWARAFKRGQFRIRLKKNQYRYADEVKARAIALREQGATWRRIAEETGVNASTCRYWFSSRDRRRSAELTLAASADAARGKRLRAAAQHHSSIAVKAVPADVLHFRRMRAFSELRAESQL